MAFTREEQRFIYDARRTGGQDASNVFSPEEDEPVPSVEELMDDDTVRESMAEKADDEISPAALEAAVRAWAEAWHSTASRIQNDFEQKLAERRQREEEGLDGFRLGFLGRR